MNDSPGWATPGSSPSDGERPESPADQPSADGGAQQPSRPAGDPKWSAEQPPPGQWSSPGSSEDQPPAATPQPGTGWGAYPQQPGQGPYGGQQAPQGAQWGQPGAWGKPPAAKPGVIPLRPLGLGEILDGAVATLRTHWRSVLPISFTVAIFAVLAITLLQGFMVDRIAELDRPSSDSDEAVISAVSGTLVAGAGALVVTFVCTIVATAMLTMIYSRAVLGRPSSVGEAWRDCRPQLLRLAGLTALVALGGGLIIAIGFVPAVIAGVAGMSAGGVLALAIIGGLAGFAVWVWLYVRVSLSPSVLMLERSSVFRSLSRSDKLVRHSWWRILGISVLASVIAGAVEFVIGIPFTVVALVSEGVSGGFDPDAPAMSWTYLIILGIGQVIAMTITLPFKAGVSVLLYVDQRIRREALDLELARAAGVENYDGAPGTPGTPGTPGVPGPTPPPTGS
ncbi:hypothetical protein ACH4U5_32500 [Streptomyces sp. NPDC020858]|uniref:hypothetical protein n=1 Tax=Streptomyces sp. NPDC020858 TaxID=3365097 RepID=UPI0037AF1BAE